MNDALHVLELWGVVGGANVVGSGLGLVVDLVLVVLVVDVPLVVVAVLVVVVVLVEEEVVGGGLVLGTGVALDEVVLGVLGVILGDVVWVTKLGVRVTPALKS